MKTFLLLLVFCLCCGVGLTDESSTGNSDVSDPVADEDDQVDSCGARRLFIPEEYRTVGGAVERLGLQFLEHLAIGPGQPNVIVSPLSLSVALAHLALGARNETEQQLLKTLSAQDLPCYHHILGNLLPAATNRSLNVAARMYLRPGFEVDLAFVEESLARYKSRPFPLVSAEEVNQWVENTTHGQIRNFLESISHDVVMMLVNAVYFKGEWQHQFDPASTSKGLFYLDNKNSVSVDMMKSAQYPLRFLDDSHLDSQVASFPFKGNSSFLIVQPLAGKENVSSVLPKLNISDLYRRLPEEKMMQVNLPKVKLQYRHQLQEALTSMGLGSLFSGPNLSGISDFPLRVSEVVHASTIELSEEGVEASAATAVTAMRSISIFVVNSPFIFALIDDATLAPIFMGVVTNPSPHESAVLGTDSDANSTMSDEPEMMMMDSVNEGNQNSERSSSRLQPVGGGRMQTCSASAGERGQLQKPEDSEHA